LPADQQPSELVKSELSAQALQIEPISAEAQAIPSSDQQLYRQLAACQQQMPAPQKPKALPEKRAVREKSIYVEIDELLREHAQRRRQQKAAAEAARAAS
jgi:hypothetical protein